MRTLLLIISSLIVLALIAGLYVWMQPPTQTHTVALPPRPRLAAGTAPATTSQTQTIIGEGQDVWVLVPDEKTGATKYRFRARRYEPQPDGTVIVTRPEAEFYLRDQIVRLEGSHGRVIMPAGESASPRLGGATAPPSRGELYDVTISMAQAARPRHPVLVASLNNIAFDNDTFRIATDAYVAPDGTRVPADQVPVRIRGQEWDFDGRGLTIRWNDRDQRLQLLQIAHGESATIKSPQLLRQLDPKSGQTDSAHIDSTPSSHREPPEPQPARRVMPVQDPAPAAPQSPRARRRAARAAPPATAPAPTTRKSDFDDTVYRAVFEGPVRITRGEQPLALADTMTVEFTLQQPSDEPPPATAPARPRQRPRPAAAAATQPHHAQPPSPIVIRWPGRLTITALPPEQAPKLRGGERNIELSSSSTPVELDYAGSQIRCGSLTHRGGQDELIIRNSPAVPLVTFTDAQGARLYTPAIHYIGSAGRATLDGASRAEVPLKHEQTGKVELLSASWTRSCVLSFAAASRDQLAIERADLSGDVNIDHPQLALRSDALQADFAPVAGAQPNRAIQLRQVIASGNVNCQMTDSTGPADGNSPATNVARRLSHIQADRLALATELSAQTGRLVPRTFWADGNVHVWDDQQELRAGNVQATLGPTTRPQEQLRIESFAAQQDVRFAMQEVSGHCDQLTATASADADDYDLKLWGQPAATVTMRRDGEQTLSGQFLNVQPKRQHAQVVGPGSLTGSLPAQAAAASGAKKPQPFEVTWERWLAYKGSQDYLEIVGNVVASTVGDDGATVTSSADKLVLWLMDDPATTQPAATRPTGAIASGGRRKTLRSATLEGNAEIRSILADANGLPLRRTHLFAPLVRYDALARQAIVPAPGRMLYENRQSDAAADSQQPAATPSAFGSVRGAFAFQWQDKLVYDEPSNRAEMLGDVVIVHQPYSASDTAAQTYRLEASRVAADLQGPAIHETSATRPAAQSSPVATSSLPMPGNLKLRQLLADGGVRFSSSTGLEFDADQIVYDPGSDVLCAQGSAHRPVEVRDQRGLSDGSFDEIAWNMRTEQIVRLRGVQARVRR